MTKANRSRLNPALAWVLVVLASRLVASCEQNVGEADSSAARHLPAESSLGKHLKAAASAKQHVPKGVLGVVAAPPAELPAPQTQAPAPPPEAEPCNPHNFISVDSRMGDYTVNATNLCSGSFYIECGTNTADFGVQACADNQAAKCQSHKSTYDPNSVVVGSNPCEIYNGETIRCTCL